MARLGARKTTGVWSPLLRPGTPESIPVAASLYALPGTATGPDKRGGCAVPDRHVGGSGITSVRLAKRGGEKSWTSVLSGTATTSSGWLAS